MDQAEILAEHTLLRTFFVENFDSAAWWEGACESNQSNPDIIMQGIRNDPIVNLALKYDLISEQWLNDLHEHLRDIKGLKEI